MIGKLIGKIAGEILALPATIANEMEEAVDEVEKTLDKRYDPPTKKEKKS